ncbi:MAG TPA: pilus assembly protein TadG-related protein [Phycicoccus sp.]|nr:pilus assembly protein TadG-related protein [Phycicoccus sp.]
MSSRQVRWARHPWLGWLRRADGPARRVGARGGADGIPARRPGADHGEDGQISLLIVGMTVIALLLILTTVAVTALGLARTRLMDAADSAALVASNALDESAYGESGLPDAVPLSNATVQQAAGRQLARLDLPSGILGWSIAAGTGSPDRRTAVVVLTGQVRVPFAEVVGSNATIAMTVQSRARAALRP